MKVELQKCWTGEQSLHYHALWSLRGRKVPGSVLRREEKVSIDIKRNAYDFQSHGTASLFDPEKRCWNRVAFIPYPQLACLKMSYVDRDVKTPKDYAEDEKRLLDEVKLLIGSTHGDSGYRPYPRTVRLSQRVNGPVSWRD